MPDELEKSTEQDILSSMGEDDAPDTTTETEVETINENNGQAPSTTNNTAVKDTSEVPAPKQEAQQGSHPQDLKLADGTVIKGGAERRLYERGAKLQRDFNETNTKLEAATAKLEAYESANSLSTQYSLTPEELTTGAQLIAAYKSDPVATVKHMLTQAQAQGYNIEDTGGLNPQAIKQMIAEAVSPLTQKHNEEQEASTQKQQAEKQWNDFQSEYPDVSVHEASLAQLLREEPNLSLHAAYYKIKTMYLERGLDWSKPLSQLQEEAKQRPQVMPNQSPTIPSGVNITNGAVRDTSEVADVDTSYEDIIRGSLREAGYNN